MKHCHFTILYNEIDFLRLKMPFLYEHFDQLIFYDLHVFGNERKFSNDGSHEFIKNYPDPDNKIMLIEETDLSGVTPLGAGNEIKCKMFSYGSKFVRDDMDVFWCTDMDEFFKEDLITEVESIFKRSVNSIGTKFYNFYKTPEFLLTYDKSLTINPSENYSVRIVRHKPGNKYGHCDIGKNYKPINLTTKNALYHLSWVGEKRVREKFSYYKDNPVTGFVSTKYIKEWEEFSEAKFNDLHKKGFYGNPFVGPGRFDRTQVTKCPFDLFEELPYLNKSYLNSLILNEEPKVQIEPIEKSKSIKDFSNIFKKKTKRPISILVTAYKSQKYIEECLNSIENQTYFKNYDNYEILVGVDGCYDTLYELLRIRKKYRNLHIYMMKNNRGTYITTNTLLSIANFNKIIRFDSDDIMKPELIQRIIEESYGFDIVRFGYDNFGNYTNNVFHFPHGVALYKRSVFDLAGGYKDWLCAADTELLNRISGIVKIKELKERLFLRRQHNDSLTNRPDTKFGSELRESYRKLIIKTSNIKIEPVINEYEEI